MGKKGKQKGPITYVGQSAKNWRQKADENLKRSLEYIKKNNIKPVSQVMPKDWNKPKVGKIGQKLSVVTQKPKNNPAIRVSNK